METSQKRGFSSSEHELGDEDIGQFQDFVREQGAALWRDLPWRNLDDPYGVLVSEVMLQQTQVKRVLAYWGRFMDLFPTVDALASAETSLVLEQWQGLGYNRRAIALKKTAETCAAAYGGELPDSLEALMELPGIGPVTAAGVMAFAHDTPCVYLETNVRSVFLHHFFPEEDGVPDSRIVPLVKMSCPEEDVRGWYYALLDYGAHLKRTVSNPSRRSRHHARQSEFEGSRRQKRAFLVRAVLGSPGISREEAKLLLDAFEAEGGRAAVREEEFAAILDDLVAEGFFAESEGGFQA